MFNEGDEVVGDMDVIGAVKGTIVSAGRIIFITQSKDDAYNGLELSLSSLDKLTVIPTSLENE